MTDHANKTLPLPAYLAEEAVLLDLIAAAKDCAAPPHDTASAAFIAAAEQELKDRGFDQPRPEKPMRGQKESMLFANGRWEIARQVFNSTTARLQWERRDGSYICGIGEERATQPLPPLPVLRAEPPGDAEVYDLVLASKKGMSQTAIAERLGCSRSSLTDGLRRLAASGLVFYVYRAKGVWWYPTTEEPKPKARKAKLLSVLFRVDKVGEVTAVFPSLRERNGFYECYSFIGQHSTCSPDWLLGTKPASEAQAADLLAELRGIYSRADDPEAVELIVRQRLPRG